MAYILMASLMLTPMTDARVHTISDSDLILFEQIVEAECYPYWSEEGYTMIAHTVVNQVGIYGDTIREVLTRPNNYTVYSNGRYKRVTVTENAKRAVRNALYGSDYKDYGQLYFCTADHLARNPNGLHGRSEEVARYRNVVFVK